jgi:hypothetical protein
MITEDQFNKAEKVVIEAQKIINQYKKEQLEILRMEMGKTSKTSIPEKNWGVHRTHCCFEHGCKYADPQCPVELGLIKQDYKCQDCNDLSLYI